MSNKGYNEIVATATLVDYRQEFAAKGSLWVEYWQDDTHNYRALFSETGTSALPITYFTQLKEHND